MLLLVMLCLAHKIPDRLAWHCAWSSCNWRIANLASLIGNTRSVQQMISPRRSHPVYRTEDVTARGR